MLFENATGTELVKCKELLQQEYPKATPFKDEPSAMIVPRPYLDEFTAFLEMNKSRLDIAIYSTGTATYIGTALASVCPWMIGKARFIWDITHCRDLDGVILKDVDHISHKHNYSPNHIRILDDSDVVVPEKNRIPVEPFVATDFSTARNDNELLRIIDVIERFMLG